MFKFERGEKALSERRNIVVMADEAHRGQYGFDEKIVMSENENGEKEVHTVIGNARVIHDALPIKDEEDVDKVADHMGLTEKETEMLYMLFSAS